MTDSSRPDENEQDYGISDFARTFFRRSSDTAHDLKTPLNIAVLNLELLRMRVRKLVDGGDPKLDEYASSLEVELRRMASIFDAFFTFASPPRNAAGPELVDFRAIVESNSESVQTGPGSQGSPFLVRAHEARIRELVRLFFEGTRGLFDENAKFRLERNEDSLTLLGLGENTIEEVAADKVFKFYYSGPSGNPDLRLASARLIAESYGGSVELRVADKGSVLELKLPSGER